jgi:DNA polymerase beta
MSTQSVKEKILTALLSLKQKAVAENEPFKVRAYNKAIKEIEGLSSIQSVNDIKSLPGIGAKIQAKISEILETGSLQEATDAAEAYSLDAYNALQEVHGIGPAKARDLITKHKILTVDALRAEVEKNPDLLTSSQKIGLHFLDDLQKRIPRAEMEKHEVYVRKILPREFEMAVVGSYRRGAATSGDFDVMITSHTLPEPAAASAFQDVIEHFEEVGYLKAAFAKGAHKYMGVCRLPKVHTHRHIDLLLCKPEEYWYTILYFTGSDVFNVSMRKMCLQKGYSLSEHGLKIMREGLPVPPLMKSEKDIFDFLGFTYVKPEDRNQILV